MGEVVVVGVGNPDRGDDAVGPAVVGTLRGRVPSGTRLTTTVGSDPSTFWDLWDGAAHVVIVDAMVSGRPPGTTVRFDVSRDPLPGSVHLVSTHAMGAPAAIELARAVGRLPTRVSVYGVEGRSFAGGAGLSEEVAGAVPGIADLLLEQVFAAAGGGGVG